MTAIGATSPLERVPVKACNPPQAEPRRRDQSVGFYPGHPSVTGAPRCIVHGRPPSRKHSRRTRSMVRGSQLPKLHLRCSSS